MATNFYDEHDTGLEGNEYQYYLSEFQSRFTNDEVLLHFADLMRQRMFAGDKVMMDWALDYMIQNIDISDAMEELVQANIHKEIDI
jgi:hypothetical protein